jgi:2-oxoacid dehydrogenases acyltransferase (catalytic domain)
MKQQHADYQLVPYPKLRRWLALTYRSAQHKPMIHGLIEVDVTRARTRLREHQAKTGEALSFTAFLMACLGKAVDEHKAVQAFRQGRKQLILFEEVDVMTFIECEMNGQKQTIPYTVRAANRKTFREIHQEIRAAQVQGVAKEICGWYSLSFPITDPRSRLYVGAGAEVLVRRGELIFRFLNPIPAMSRGFPLVPDDEKDPYVFRIDFSRFGMGTTRVLFGREPRGGTTVIPELGVMPLPLRKQPSAKNPRLCATAALAVAGAGFALRRFRATRKKRLARNSHHGDSHSAAP